LATPRQPQSFSREISRRAAVLSHRRQLPPISDFTPASRDTSLAEMSASRQPDAARGRCRRRRHCRLFSAPPAASGAAPELPAYFQRLHCFLSIG